MQSELSAPRASALDLQQREAALANQQHAVAAAEAAVTRERQMLARERQQLQVTTLASNHRSRQRRRPHRLVGCCRLTWNFGSYRRPAALRFRTVDSDTLCPALLSQ